MGIDSVATMLAAINGSALVVLFSGSHVQHQPRGVNRRVQLLG